MKIIIANKYFYLDGGPERYMFGLMDHLGSMGHTVVPFSMAYDKNKPSEYSRYFVPPAGGGSGTKLDKLEGGIEVKLRIAARSVYSLEARRRLEQLIVDEKPDIIYGLNIVNHMSPSIVDAARRHNVPVVLRMSDYYLMCPSYLMLRDRNVCTECVDGAYYNAVKHKCVYGSMVASLPRVAGMYIQKWLGMYRHVSAMVTTTEFMREMLMRAGFPGEKIHLIRTFVDTSKWSPSYDNAGFLLYVGRLTPEKGVECLLHAYKKSGVSDPLCIVGDGPPEYTQQLHSMVRECNISGVEFLGKKTGEDLVRIVQGAKYVIVPSLWYDNAPNVVYESFASGKPVIASALGGLREQVTEDTGVLVEAGNADELASAMAGLSSDAALVCSMGQNARARVERENSVEVHAEKLLDLFREVAADKYPY
ncbi:MAG: glycosyltransferase family 4 protein [Armatimonadota bacterium]